jgi:hypothetical protein
VPLASASIQTFASPSRSEGRTIRSAAASSSGIAAGGTLPEQPGPALEAAGGDQRLERRPLRPFAGDEQGCAGQVFQRLDRQPVALERHEVARRHDQRPFHPQRALRRPAGRAAGSDPPRCRYNGP